VTRFCGRVEDGQIGHICGLLVAAFSALLGECGSLVEKVNNLTVELGELRRRRCSPSAGRLVLRMFGGGLLGHE
jgi:hypothetical protein